MSAADWLFGRFIVLILGVIVVSIVVLGIRDRKIEEVKDSCQVSCLPLASKVIDDVCHCATKDGWVRFSSNTHTQGESK